VPGTSLTSPQETKVNFPAWLRAPSAAVVAALALGVPMIPDPAGALTGDSLANKAFENISSDHDHTLTEAKAHAQRFDAITAVPGAYQGMVPEMKAVNSKLRVLVYMNGTFAQKSQGTLYPETWYLRDRYGRKVTSKNYGNFLMNPNNAGWQKERANFCLEQLQRSGYDGCTLDMLGSAPLDPGYLTALPVNPATGQVFTEAAWINATAAVARAVKAALGTRPVIANGLRSGPQYFAGSAPSEVLLDAADGGVAEAWLRAASWGITKFRDETGWKQEVDMIVDAEARGDAVYTLTKVWASGTAAQKDAWHEYALASFLLGAGPRSQFGFSYSPGESPTGTHPWWQLSLGSPTARYAKSGGVYQRPYGNGKVLVNPTDARVTVSLGGTFVDLRGTRVTSVVMGPNTGKVLRRV
jgi:hypothetical protein